MSFVVSKAYARCAHRFAVRCRKYCLVVCLAFSWVSSVQAHEAVSDQGSLRDGPARQSELSISAVVNARATESPGDNPYPSGVLASDEVRYADTGLHVEAFSIGWQQPLSASTWVSIVASQHGASHGGGGDHASEIEELVLRYQSTTRTGQVWQIGLGQQMAAPRPWLSWHGDNPQQPLAPLFTDVLFARHAVDTGVHLETMIDGSSLGAAVWNGDAWPASAGKGAAALF